MWHELRHGLRVPCWWRLPPAWLCSSRCALVLALAGVALGALGALATRRLLSGLLYGITVADPLGLLAASLLLVTACLAAGYLPARRASRVDPAATLRSE